MTQVALLIMQTAQLCAVLINSGGLQRSARLGVLAARFGLPVGDAMSRLINMARHGLVWY